ncbi:nuclear transcription factor Y subunit B-1-like [Phoenix dactylifera]|uniref:Nuclear transcription factor Y subunit B-1-like n=1 Tax=Phoenix dactylifera TaxID=42345 RepID=A0A8B7BKD4_PHODC|nr:nuclear transcription factor Y subunit B-1-like [Phoenix dactylifera]
MADGVGNSPESEGHPNNFHTAQGTSGGAASGDGGIKEQDRLLPIANVGRIMKQILPPNAKISKEAKETMQECVSEFISFVTGEASDKCHKEKRKTVNGDDICWALSTLGFDDYAEPMRRYLQKYREMEGDRAASGSQNSRANSMDARDEVRGEQQKYQSSGAGQSMFNAMEGNNASTSRRF